MKSHQHLLYLKRKKLDLNRRKSHYLNHRIVNQLLFRSKPGTTWWDGTYNGALLPPSDYYYVITVEPGASPITGTVSLKY